MIVSNWLDRTRVGGGGRRKNFWTGQLHGISLHNKMRRRVRSFRFINHDLELKLNVSVKFSAYYFDNTFNMKLEKLCVSIDIFTIAYQHPFRFFSLFFFWISFFILVNLYSWKCTIFFLAYWEKPAVFIHTKQYSQNVYIYIIHIWLKMRRINHFHDHSTSIPKNDPCFGHVLPLSWFNTN